MTPRVQRSLISALGAFFFASTSTNAFVIHKVLPCGCSENRRALGIEETVNRIQGGFTLETQSASRKRGIFLPVHTSDRRRDVPTATEKPHRSSSLLFAQSRRMLGDDSTRFSSQSFYMDVTGNKKGIVDDWKERLRRVSTFASLLCVLDCTLLPIVTVILPLLGLAGSPAHMAWIHALGHKMAMFFVLPVGGLAATLNYTSHKKLSIAIPAAIGLLLVYLANAGSGVLLVTQLPHDIAHAFQCGSAHRITNIVGCALLLGSNYVSRQLGCANDSCLDPNCVDENPHVRRYSQL
mmetsp:Transcript_1756/g.2452  ORF Transcript_1756/g.2452 Transcript_1756/m.2452 type:complete len:294 (-) Transcript_1756:199-1080(-)